MREGPSDYFEPLLHTQPWPICQNASVDLELKQCGHGLATEFHSLLYESTEVFKATLPASMTTR